MADKIRAKPQIVKIKDVEFELHKIKTSELLEMASLQQKGDNIGAVKYILMQTLKKARIREPNGNWETLTEADIEVLDPVVINELIKKITEINGMKTEAPLSNQVTPEKT